MKALDTPIPDLMSGLKKDSRGFPIPYIVFRDIYGTPHFKINDHKKRDNCVFAGLCAICGQALGEDRWFVGGPLSAFHAQGAYIDPPIHEACGTYALQVCPFLANKSYKHIEMDLEKLSNEHDRVVVDPTMIAGQPELFVFLKFSRLTLVPDLQQYKLRPLRPYKEIQFWKNGVRLDDITADAVLYELFGVWGLQKSFLSV